MQTPYEKLEFTAIKEMLAEHALSENAKNQCRALVPEMNENICRRKMELTTGARAILDAHGNPPITAMQDMDALLTLCKAGSMLLPDQLVQVERFLVACGRMQSYLRKATGSHDTIASYGDSFLLPEGLQDEINRCIRNGRVDSAASPALQDLRRKIDHTEEQIQAQLSSLAQSKRQWLSDGSAVRRNGRYVLPVRREHKGKISGAVVDMSGTGGTVFIEPSVVAKLSAQLATLQIEEDNEVRRVLYTLSALVDEHAPALRLDMEAMETLDFLFAKAKFSAALGAGPVGLTAHRSLRLKEARHPLLPKEGSVPLNLEMDAESRGVIITGPNTGGKTVALKTIGLLSLMAQCGLHITAHPASEVCLYSHYLCDLGDGQSISENLSTFSSHMASIIEILAQADRQSLVLLDELGSGTDPAEGMGIAIAVLETLRNTRCMLVATTHYPEVKEYANQAEGYTNARMAFDRETLKPTYRLEIGQAGESCALYIAQRLGLPQPVLQYAQRQAYQGTTPHQTRGGNGKPVFETMEEQHPAANRQARITPAKKAGPVSAHAASFGYGDSVTVYPRREFGIVFQPANSKGEVGIQVKGEKRWIPHKRLKLETKADMLYPPDYDFSVVFDTVENRKAHKQMGKRHVKGSVIHHGVYEFDNG